MNPILELSCDLPEIRRGVLRQIVLVRSPDDIPPAPDAETGIQQGKAIEVPFSLRPANLVDGSACVLVFGDRTFRLREGENVIGRDSANAVTLESPLVSRRHARVTIDRGRAFVEDLRSKNGTFVGNQRVQAPTEISDGAEIRIGQLWLIFHTASSASW
jgi:FHA domain